MSVPLQANCLAVGYNEKLVLSGVTFDLAPGEVVALLGPNGGGKTTLLRTLAGLIPKICGSIMIDGEDIDSLSIRNIARKIGFVPQEEAWNFDFTVAEVVAMGRMPISNGFFDTEEDRDAADEAMREAECFDLRQRRITELSGGERQRVLIARALAQATPVLFLDEPTSHLDPKHQAGTCGILRKLASHGKTLLVAIHDLPVASTVADRGILVYNRSASETMPMHDLLQSEELDEAYSVGFERVKTSSGRLLVVPKS